MSQKHRQRRINRTDMTPFPAQSASGGVETAEPTEPTEPTNRAEQEATATAPDADAPYAPDLPGHLDQMPHSTAQAFAEGYVRLNQGFSHALCGIVDCAIFDAEQARAEATATLAAPLLFAVAEATFFRRALTSLAYLNARHRITLDNALNALAASVSETDTANAFDILAAARRDLSESADAALRDYDRGEAAFPICGSDLLGIAVAGVSITDPQSPGREALQTYSEPPRVELYDLAQSAGFDEAAAAAAINRELEEEREEAEEKGKG